MKICKNVIMQKITHMCMRDVQKIYLTVQLRSSILCSDALTGFNLDRLNS